MHRTARPLLLAVVLALATLVGTAQSALGAPTFYRQHIETVLRFDDCGIGTLAASVDLNLAINEVAGHTSLVTHFVGTGVDTVTGLTYHLVDRGTQMFRAPTTTANPSGPYLNVAEETFVVSGPNGGLVARGMNRLSINPNGSVNEFSMHFESCHPG
jgi:hypothetical protein